VVGAVGLLCSHGTFLEGEQFGFLGLGGFQHWLGIQTTDSDRAWLLNRLLYGLGTNLRINP
jgi:hypothetical protein